MMKRIAGIALALLMLAASVACAKVNVKGTWKGQADMTQQMTSIMSQYGFDWELKDCIVGMTVTIDDNEKAVIDYDVSTLEKPFREAVLKALEAEGIEASDAEIDTFMEAVMTGIRSSVESETYTYRLDGKKITIGGAEGTVSGDTMKIDFGDFGKVTFTRSK